MRSDALFQRYDTFVAAASVGAHANCDASGFRQRDVRFLIDLFANWFEATIPGKLLPIQNTQVQRYLEDLVKDGFARRSVRKKQPQYRLTRVGLVELIGRIVNQVYYQRPEHFFFAYYFIENYRDRIFQLIKEEGTQFPHTLEVEVRELLDPKPLIQRQLQETEREINNINVRISDALKTGKLALELFAAGSDTKDVVSEVERRHPYELNSQKPLSELFSSMAPAVVRWELETGSIKRAEHLWVPVRALLQEFAKLLRKMEVNA